MPIRHAIWRVGETASALAEGRLPSERTLEDLIVKNPSIISSQWMIVGQQVPTAFGGRVDLLAIEPDASLVLIELKRDRTPRDIIAQTLDYAVWLEDLNAARVAEIYKRFSNGGELAQAFKQRFGADLDDDTVNETHKIVIVASELDDTTERVMKYLNERNVPINTVFFQVFQHGAEQLISRSWFIDPGETQANAAGSGRTHGEKEPWNGEYYVSYGADRSWEDARQYGFVSGGGGSWFSQTLRLLKPTDRVWVRIPQTGYVGVGRVTEASRPVKDFEVSTPTGLKPALDVLHNATVYRANADDPEKAEYFVRVQWLDTVPENRAIAEAGLFGNQNTVCRPRTPLWRHTVERLKTHFPKWDSVAM